MHVWSTLWLKSFLFAHHKIHSPLNLDPTLFFFSFKAIPDEIALEIANDSDCMNCCGGFDIDIGLFCHCRKVESSDTQALSFARETKAICGKT